MQTRVRRMLHRAVDIITDTRDAGGETCGYKMHSTDR